MEDIDPSDEHEFSRLERDTQALHERALQNWATAPSWRTLNEIMNHAHALGALSKGFCVPADSETSITVEMVTDDFVNEIHGEWALSGLVWCDAEGNNLASIDWRSDETSYDVALDQLRRKIRAFGDVNAANWLSRNLLIDQLSAALTLAIRSRNGTTSYSYSPLIMRVGDQWLITEYGLECIGNGYPVEIARIKELDWVPHMTSKTWVDVDEFRKAFYKLEQLWLWHPEFFGEFGMTEFSNRQFRQLSAEAPAAAVEENMRVFIVHGHETDAAEALARFIESSTTATAVILHEQEDDGSTVIEKFEREAKLVAFAVSLLSPDDLGNAKNSESLNPRARQNVMFETGWFMGALGRKNVAILLWPTVEQPSDLAGIIYIKRDDSNGWRQDLLKHMKSAGVSLKPIA